MSVQHPSSKFHPALADYSDVDYMDDDSTPLNQEIYGGSRRSMQETKAWDSFRIVPQSMRSYSNVAQNYVALVVKILKVVVYFITFAAVLGCGVIAKALVLLMTSQLKKEKKLNICSSSYQRLLAPEKRYSASIPEEENVAWAWVLFFAFVLPELGTWFRSTRMCVFKSWRKPSFDELFFVVFFETLHTVGTGLLIYLVLPDLDVIKGAMLTNCLAFLPCLFGMMSRNKKEPRFWGKIMIDLLALISQVSGFIVWPLVAYMENTANWQIWLIPIAIFMTSCGWWENYVDKQSRFSMIRYFANLKTSLGKTRYFIYIFVSLWKILLFFGVMIFTMYSRLANFSTIFRLKEAFSSHVINVTEDRQLLPGNFPPDAVTVAPLEQIVQIVSVGSAPVYVFLVHMLAAWICYIFGKFACKICIQGFSFAFPVNFTIPVSISLLMTACGLRYAEVCSFGFLPPYLFWECKNGDILRDFLNNDYAWIWLFWLLSQTWITIHIWTPKCERLASTEKLFVSPMYNALLIDQSLALNRRRDDEAEVMTDDMGVATDEPDQEASQHYETLSNHTDSSNANNVKTKSADHITKIYACATMWHETKEEMMEILKSIFRMDEDQCARRIAHRYLKVVDPDYYDFETHILFDDAFEMADENEDENVVNMFVKDLISLIDTAATNVHETDIQIRPPKKYPTPYGGRLVWTLPGKTKITCHLKDKSKIRHKKRWSQVMYMYYLLGFRLMDQRISVDRKEIIAENTFLLTLDGDIDFTPKAVRLLVDLMKKNTNLGAACGRIHPIGSGMMVWYQMFEYALGHWLQKATEHMIGCVLCSPGCFSLFRAKALMDDNVMAKYTTKSCQARQYVQYDQGEDRWLCTLLLQRGYRVEYCAASDAYTHCPEGFSEFYNQRRRWVPSTMANIMDLLQDYKRTIKVNDNISFPYIVYQSMLMAGTILGPGTIFLMLVGAFVAAFKIGNWLSFQYNFTPILIFILCCFLLKSHHQELEAERKALEEARKKEKDKGLLGFLYKDSDKNESKGSMEFSLAGLFKIMFCVQDVPNDRKRIADAIDELNKKMDNLEANLGLQHPPRRRSTTSHRGRPRDDQSTSEDRSDADYGDEESEESAPKRDRDGLSTYWMEDKALIKGEVSNLPPSEVMFWNDLIEKYLYPLDVNVQEQARISQDLKELRNKSVFAFFMMNALFILIVFLLQLNKDQLHIDWPLGVRINTTILPETGETLIHEEYLQLEPIGLVFVFFFAFILVIQFVAMLFHRFGTLSHILASTELNCCSKAEDMTEDAYIQRRAVHIVLNMQRLRNINGEIEDYEGSDVQLGRRKTIHHLEHYRQKRPAIGTLDVAFKKRFASMQADAKNGEDMTPILDIGGGLSIRPETIRALAERRENVVQERRKSKMETLGAKKPRTRASIASDADNQRVFTPNGGTRVNEAFDHDSDIYGAPPSVRSSLRTGSAVPKRRGRGGFSSMDVLDRVSDVAMNDDHSIP